MPSCKVKQEKLSEPISSGHIRRGGREAILEKDCGQGESLSLGEFIIRCRAEDSENLPYEAVSPYVREQHGLCPWKPTFSIQLPSPILLPSCNEFATVRKTRRTFASLALDDDEALLSIDRSAARSSASKNVLLSMRSAQKPLKSRARSITRIQTLQITGLRQWS